VAGILNCYVCGNQIQIAWLDRGSTQYLHGYLGYDAKDGFVCELGLSAGAFDDGVATGTPMARAGKSPAPCAAEGDTLRADSNTSSPHQASCQPCHPPAPSASKDRWTSSLLRHKENRSFRDRANRLIAHVSPF
jgi:hypothetical protein